MKDVKKDVKKEFPLSEQNFLYLKILASRCGIDLNEYKDRVIYNQLVKRLRKLNINNFDDYCALLRVNIDEEIKFINLITNSTTYFFRENHHFEFLKDYLSLGLTMQKNKMRIWCCGCSTGEEAYSIAMTICETIKDISLYDIKILATDINYDALIEADNGVFSKEKMETINLNRKIKWFQKIETTDNLMVFKIKDEIKNMITFNQLNLFEQWPIQTQFDIIFCRNVIIYFKKDNINLILKKFHALLKDNGLLFLGHSENLQDQKPLYKNVGKSIYKKIHRGN